MIPLYTPQNLGTKQASIVENSLSRTQEPGFLEDCIELLAQHDEQLLAAYVNDEPVTEAQVLSSLTSQIKDARLYPIFFGSAMTGVGVAELLKGVAAFFPVTTGEEHATLTAPLSAVVFKIEREAAGEKIAYLRVFSGSIQVREDVPVRSKRDEQAGATPTYKVKKLHLFRQGQTVQTPKMGAGEFCKVWGFKDIRIGDVVGEWSDSIKDLHFVAPQMEAQIEAQRAGRESSVISSPGRVGRRRPADQS